MTKFLMALFLAFSLFSCDTPENKSSNLYDFVPEKSSYIIESENISEFLNNVSKSNILKELETFNKVDLLGIKNYTPLYTPSNSLLCFIKKDSLDFNYLYITKAKEDSLFKQTQKDLSIETITTKDFSYKKTIIDNFTIFSAEVNKTILSSNSLQLLKHAATDKKTDKADSENFKKVVAARSKGKTSLFVNHQYSKNSIADWSVVDFELNENKFNFNGIAIAKKQSSQLLNIFQGVLPQKNEISSIAPNSYSAFYSFTYNNFDIVSENIRLFNGDSLSVSKSSILNYTKEAGAIFLGDETAIALTLVDPQVATDAFPLTDELKSEFRGVPIYIASEIDYLKQLEPLISISSPKYYMLLENFLVYAEEEKTLERIISSFQNNLTVDKNLSFMKVQEGLAEASSLVLVTKPQLSKTQKFNSFIFKEFSPFNDLGKEYSVAATQFVSSAGFTHIHGVVLNNSDLNSSGIQELVTTTLPINIDGRTFVLKNHSTKEVELAVQDENNVLSILNLDRKILWRKKLQTQIIGNITQVDLFKNGNLQMAFTTLNKFHILDRNGKYLKAFPLEFQDNITQPVAIFDYDNNKNYRFVIVQDKELLMYDSKGKSVKGFDFKRAPSEIIQPPKHIRLKNKDYIVFPEKNGKLNILSRQGKERISIKEKFQFSENEWYENRNDFVSVSEVAKLIRVNQSGKISAKQFTTDGNLQIAANENTLVLLSENILKINDKELTLDFGLYSSPKIFRTSGKTYVSIVDTQAKKVYLFSEKGELVPNFPVYGISLIDIVNSKTRNKSTMLVLGESNEIISYEF